MKRDVADRLVVDDGVAADLMFHKSEQPSPISVLESPFEEESPSPLEFKEITNDLQGGKCLPSHQHHMCCTWLFYVDD
jgi:hypothetical protein